VKVVCASCGAEHEQPAESCASCGEPLVGWASTDEPEAPVTVDDTDTAGSSGDETAEEGAAPAAAPANNLELDAIRDEIEAEVGSLFDVEPDRELRTSDYLLGDRRKRPRTPTDPGVPAYRVVEVSSPRRETNVASSPQGDAPDSPAEAKSSAEAPEESGHKVTPVSGGAEPPATPSAQETEEEPEWRPAASALASLMQEEMATARAREADDQVDEMIRPPVLKPKPPPGPEPAPPPAFDEDVPGDKSGGAGLAPAIGTQNRDGSPRGAGSAKEKGGRGQNKLLLGLAAIGALIIFGLLTIIVVLLLRPPQYATGTPVVAAPPPTTPTTPAGQPPAGLVPVTAPPATPGGTTAASPDAGRADTSVPDTAIPDTSLPDTAQPDTAPPPSPPPVERPVAVAEAPPARLPAWAERSPKPKDPKPRDPKPKDPAAAEAEQKPAEPPPKPKLPPGARPPGCDPIAYPNPKDCPAERPPSKSEILAVVRRHVRDIDRCAKKQHAADPALASGVITMSWWIYPSGESKRVKVVSPEFQNTLVGNCIESAIEGWSWGEYSGKRIGPIKMPFKLNTK